ncbi:MAG: 4Fe-4S binding protein [Clostridiaceae bacterium]|nr:4Fe-4S binding protein [Clostridiaceae bacterium]
MKKHWYDYLWVFSSIYLLLGFINILFAWIGLICFFVPIIIAVLGGGKAYCNRYCGRGQLFALLGGRLGLSRKKAPPKFLRSKWFRYGFLIFFFAMFFAMLWNTWLVFQGTQDLRQVVKLLWTIKLPWQWAYHGTAVEPWVAQFSFGFYSVMLTSTVLGIITMTLYKPRSWCVYCPMGTMTQLICKTKSHKSVCLSCNEQNTTCTIQTEQ